MCGLLPILLLDLFYMFRRKPPAKKEICEEAVKRESEPTQEEPKAVEKNIVSSAKPIWPVSKNIDIPMVRNDNYQPVELSPKMLYEIGMRAMRTKNKSRRRAYETLQWKELQKDTESFSEQYNPDRSDSPELMFQMDDID